MLPSIIKGGESFFYPGGDPGCLVVHGFTASPQEVHWLGNHLSECGFTVLGLRLFGHGTTLNDMARSRKGDWIASVEDGYHILQSMCTTLAQLSVPGLFIHSRTDDFVPHDHMISNFELLGSANKEKVSIALSNHIITCDISREQVFSTVEDFVNRKSGFEE